MDYLDIITPYTKSKRNPASLYLSINQVQRQVKATWVMGVLLPARTRYEKRKHAGWVHIAAWV